MVDLPSLVVQIVVGAIPLGVAFFAYRSATDANRKTAEAAIRSAEKQAELERTKVDSEAFGRAKAIYEDALDQLEKQAGRMQGELDKINARLAREQGISNALRGQVTTLERVVSGLRSQMINAGMTPLDIHLDTPISLETEEEKP